MSVLVRVLWLVCLLFLICLFVRMILSYVSMVPGSTLQRINHAVVAITDPLLRPVRRVLPFARFGGAALDLSPLVVSIAIIIVMRLL